MIDNITLFIADPTANKLALMNGEELRRLCADARMTELAAQIVFNEALIENASALLVLIENFAIKDDFFVTNYLPVIAQDKDFIVMLQNDPLRVEGLYNGALHVRKHKSLLFFMHLVSNRPNVDWKKLLDTQL